MSKDDGASLVRRSADDTGKLFKAECLLDEDTVHLIDYALLLWIFEHRTKEGARRRARLIVDVGGCIATRVANLV